MSFKDCIQTAADSGRLSERKGEEGKAAFDEKFDEAVAAGLPPEQARLQAQLKAVEEISSLKADKRWQRINEMQKAHRIYTRIMNSDDPARALQEIIERIEIGYERISGQAMAGLDAFILKYKPKNGGWSTPTEDLDDMARAAYGDTSNQAAADMYKAVAETYEFLRNRANMEGASIPENKNRRLPQTHDRFMVSKVPKSEWVGEHLEALDWEVMRYGGKEIPVDKRAEILGKVYDGITTNGDSSVKPGQGEGQPALAGRLARDRFLYYKDAESWLKMQKKYGSGNVFQQTIGMIDAMSRDIALMEQLGPNPNTLKNFAFNASRRRGADLQTQGKGDWTDKTAAARDLFIKEYDIFNYHVLSGEGNLLVQGLATARTITNSALLGNVFISSLPDIGVTKWARAYYNMPAMKSVGLPYLKHFANGDVSAAQAIRAGVVYESGVAMALNRLRYIGSLDGAAVGRRVGDIVYRMGGAHLHFSTMRHINAMELLGFWADTAGKRFDEHPQLTHFQRFGITEKDWDTFRASQVRTENGATFLQPLDLWNAGNAAEKRVADKFQDFMQTFIRDAVPNPDLRARAAMGHHITPQSAVGQAVRSGTALLSFPITIMFNHWAKIFAMPGAWNKMKWGSSFIAQMTVGGAFVTQLKALISGQELHDMTLTNDEGELNDFWGRALVNGGSLGLLGDFVFNSVNLGNSDMLSFGGPLADWGAALKKLTIDNAQEAYAGTPVDELKLGADAINLANRTIPRLWYLRLLWDRHISDAIMEESDPAGFARRQRYIEENNPSGRWAEPGEDIRAPNLMTAFGE